jgi:hypothetical protein
VDRRKIYSLRKSSQKAAMPNSRLSRCRLY